MIAYAHTQDTTLMRRGIASACQDANWEPYTFANQSGWRYPIYNKLGFKYAVNNQYVYRWKNADSNGTPKYAWLPGKPEGVKYYILPGTLDAISKSSGVVYIASGEPDVMAYRAAGFSNVICWFGETSIPETLVSDLINHMGVGLVRTFPDLDKAGFTMAAKLHEMFDGTDILFIPQRLPGPMDSKNDINQLWQSVQFNRERFHALLLDAPAISADDLTLYRTADDAPHKITGGVSSYTGELPDGFKRDIISHVERQEGFKRWGADGWSNNFKCPCHTEDNASAGFNKDSMSFKCFVCGSLSAKEFGEHVGIHLRDYFDHDIKPAKPPTTAPAPTAANIAVVEPTVQIEPAYIESNDVTQKLIDELMGLTVPDIEPMEFPFKSFHRFGGFAEMMFPGKLVYISGISGGGKTSFGETIYEMLMQKGIDSIWFGPEWSAEEMKIRALQRAGGLNMIQFGKHRVWQIDKHKGVAENARRGAAVSQAEVQKAIHILQAQLKWSGQAYFLSNGEEMNSINKILDTTEQLVIQKRAQGRKVSALFFDYLQRAPKGGGAKGWDWSEDVVRQIKSTCERLKLFGFIFIQPTKGESKLTREGAALNESSGQGVSDQQANLYFTLTPAFDENRNRLPLVKASVVKNSMGRTGDVILKWATQNLSIVDEEANMSNYSDVKVSWNG